MAPPVLTQSIQGQGSVSADQLNSYLQACASLSQLRGFTGLPNMMVYLEGISTPGDGGQGPFYWNSTSTGTDDNANTIQPTGTTIGRWLRLPISGSIATPRTAINDQNYSAISTDQWISYTVLSVTRTVILPLASAETAGQILAIGDESGSCSLTTQILVSTQGSNKFNTSLTNFPIVSPYSYVEFRSNGTNLWIIHQ